MSEKKKIENSLGMFDLLKGLVMFAMVAFHNGTLFSELFIEDISSISAGNGTLLTVRILLALLTTVGISFMPALLVVCGYGFRKRAISKGFKTFFPEIVKPYIYTAVATALVHLIMHYAFFKYLPGAVKETLKVLGGMALGFSQTTKVGDIYLFANGPVWYLLALFWSVVVFNIVLNKVQEKYVVYVVLAISLVGWLLSFLQYLPFCISQGLVGVLYIYIGYKLKKSKFYSKEHSAKEIIIYSLAVILPNIVMCFFGGLLKMADNEYTFGPVTIIESGLFGILLLYFFLRLNVLKGPIAKGFRTVGRYSLYIMCVHAVEMIAVPWYLLGGHFEDKPLLGYFVIYISRMVVIFIGVFCVVKVSAAIKTIREKKADERARASKE